MGTIQKSSSPGKIIPLLFCTNSTKSSQYFAQRKNILLLLHFRFSRFFISFHSQIITSLSFEILKFLMAISIFLNSVRAETIMK
jgi:hypothetical protein